MSSCQVATGEYNYEPVTKLIQFLRARRSVISTSLPLAMYLLAQGSDPT